MLTDSYIEGTYGAHHLRVVRIVRQKGFLEEKELTKFSLLPQRNLRVILSRLICEGILQTQDLPQSFRGNTGPFYGLAPKALTAAFQKRLAQSVLNLLAKQGHFGQLGDLLIEFNHLNF